MEAPRPSWTAWLGACRTPVTTCSCTPPATACARFRRPGSSTRPPASASAAPSPSFVTSSTPTRRWRGYDIVHDHTLVGPVYAERFPGLPVVTTNHGPFDGDLRDYYRAISGRVPVIAISHHQASTAREIPVAGVIHHGIDTDKFAARHRRRRLRAVPRANEPGQGRAHGDPHRPPGRRAAQDRGQAPRAARVRVLRGAGAPAARRRHRVRR